MEDVRPVSDFADEYKKCESVIVLDGAFGSVLSVCKNAQLNGLQTFVVCIDKECCGIYEGSQYITAVYYSTIDCLFETFCEIRFTHLLKEKPLLYFTADIYCMVINKNREYYSQVVVLCLPSSDIIEAFCYKDHSGCIAEKYGLTVPRNISINDIHDVETVLNTFIFPVILKPLSVENHKSVLFKYKILERGEFVAMKSEAWNSLAGNVLCQEYIPGDDSSYWFYTFFRNDKGDVIECMGEKTMQSNGIMAIGTTKFNKELSKISREFLGKIGYIGIGGIEYKKFNNKYYFIEMSTRTEGFLPISDMAGVSCADASFQWYVEHNDSYKGKLQQDDVRYISVLSVIAEILRRKKLKIIFHSINLILYRMNSSIVELYFKDGTFARHIRQIIKIKIGI